MILSLTLHGVGVVGHVSERKASVEERNTADGAKAPTISTEKGTAAREDGSVHGIHNEVAGSRV